MKYTGQWLFEAPVPCWNGLNDALLEKNSIDMLCPGMNEIGNTVKPFSSYAALDVTDAACFFFKSCYTWITALYHHICMFEQ